MELKSMMDDVTRGKASLLVNVRKSIVDMLLLNYQSISFFMSRAYNLANKEIEDAANMTSTRGTIGAWCVGKEFIKTKPQLASKFLYKDTIEINELPSEEIRLLKIAVDIPFHIFSVVLTEYYDSEYGQKMKHQKERHFIDTYQSMMKGILACFLDGIQS